MWSNVAQRVWSDQRRIWIFPRHIARRDTWKPALIIVGVTAGLVAADAPVSSYFRGNARFAEFNSVLGGRNTQMAMMAVPVAFCVAGLIHRKPDHVKTALLAGEAVLAAEIVTSVMKNMDHRLRPIASSPQNVGAAWFADKGLSVGGKGSFPSGHAIAAFSIATVFARRYQRRRWVSFAAYGLAGAIAFSRMSSMSHYGSDVFLGAALGISISRFVVLR